MIRRNIIAITMTATVFTVVAIATASSLGFRANQFSWGSSSAVFFTGESLADSCYQYRYVHNLDGTVAYRPVNVCHQ